MVLRLLDWHRIAITNSEFRSRASAVATAGARLTVISSPAYTSPQGKAAPLRRFPASWLWTSVRNCRSFRNDGTRPAINSYRGLGLAPTDVMVVSVPPHTTTAERRSAHEISIPAPLWVESDATESRRANVRRCLV